jgi:hypothetical protein
MVESKIFLLVVCTLVMLLGILGLIFGVKNYIAGLEALVQIWNVVLTSICVYGIITLARTDSLFNILTLIFTAAASLCLFDLFKNRGKIKSWISPKRNKTQ